jgi:hypothetical protein
LARTERYCVQFLALAALRDRALPAAFLRWGFGGDGDGRRTTEEIPMTKATAKRKPTSRANDSKTQSRNSVSRTSARKAAPLKPVTVAVHRRPPARGATDGTP